MAEPSSNETCSPQFWLVHHCRWLWTGLLWVWGAMIVGIGINIGSTWLISPTFNIAHTPLGWLLAHLLITIPVGAMLLILTATTGFVTVVHRKPSPSHSSSTLEQQNRERFLAKLQNRYNDILEQSLQGAVQIALGFRHTPYAVINTTRLRFHQVAQPEQELPARTSILQVYDRANGELLILGEPGAGKTTQLLNLAAALQDQATQNEHHPIPVIVNLSTWANNRRPLQEWLIEEVATSYDVPHRPVAKWIESVQLLPLLDGLDEVPRSALAACIEAINVFHREHLVPLVVCSRSEEYLEQQERLALRSAVVVQLLDAEQVDTYFKETGPQFAGVRSMLRRNAELRELVKTPLMLHVLTLAYRGVSVRALPRRGSIEEQRQQIFDHYVQRMLSKQDHLSPFPAEQMRHDIAWLAQQMQAHNQTIFYLEQLQPDWLPIDSLRQMYEVLAIRIPGIFIGVLVSLLVTNILYSFVIPDSIWYGLIGGLIGGLVSGSRPFSFQFFSIRRAWKNRWWQYLLVSLGIGVFLGGVTGVAFALWDVQSFLAVKNGLQSGLIFGISAGLNGLLLCILIGVGKTPVLQTEPLERRDSRWWHRIANKDMIRLGVLVGMLIGLSDGLSAGLSYGLSNGLSAGLSYGLSNGLDDGLTLGLIGLLLGFLLLGRKNIIEPAELVVWSVKLLGRSLTLKHHLRNTLLLLLLTGLLFVLTNGLSYGLGHGLSYGLSNGLITGLVYWILLGLWNGVSRETLDDPLRIVPNEGIRRSMHNSLLMGLIAGGLCGLFGFLNGAIDIVPGFRQSDMLSIELTFVPSVGLSKGLIFGMLGGLLAGLLTGGWACLQHLLLRVLLWRGKLLPWHAVQFLDGAAHHIFLFKEGGGYRFIHRLFLDYFASLEIPSSSASINKQETAQAGVS